MSKRFSLFAALLLTCSINANSQGVELPLDSLTKILCDKKWEIDYVLMEGMKIYRTPDAANMIFDFKKDQTLTANDGKSKELQRGKWVYDPKKKIIKLTISGASLMMIVAISPEQFITAIDPAEAKKTNGGNPDLGDIKTVFKIRKE